MSELTGFRVVARDVSDPNGLVVSAELGRVEIKGNGLPTINLNGECVLRCVLAACQEALGMPIQIGEPSKPEKRSWWKGSK